MENKRKTDISLSNTDIHRFMAKVSVTAHGCHEYTGATLHGYGVFWLNGKNVKAHRVSYVIAHGSIPDGMQVNHHCDNRVCVNPEHIYAGTTQENINDRESRGRGRRVSGESHHKTTLRESDVLKIRAMYSGGKITYKALAEMFSVSCNAIGQIIRQERWANMNPNQTTN